MQQQQKNGFDTIEITQFLTCQFEWLLIVGTAMTLRPRGALNSKRMTGDQETAPPCNKETVGN